MDSVIKIIVLAVLVEGTTETLKLIWKGGKLNTNQILALAVGIGIAVTTQVDIFTVVGIESSIDIVGIILTGILISRGGNFIHDLMDRIRNIGK